MFPYLLSHISTPAESWFYACQVMQLSALVVTQQKVFCAVDQLLCSD